MRTMRIWHEENCYLKHMFCWSSKVLQFNIFHMLESIQCLQTGKELWPIVTSLNKVTLALQTGEKNV